MLGPQPLAEWRSRLQKVPIQTGMVWPSTKSLALRCDAIGRKFCAAWGMASRVTIMPIPGGDYQRFDEREQQGTSSEFVVPGFTVSEFTVRSFSFLGLKTPATAPPHADVCVAADERGQFENLGDDSSTLRPQVA